MSDLPESSRGGSVPGVEIALLCAELAASRRRETWLSAAADVITLMLMAENSREVLTLVAERAREAAAALSPNPESSDPPERASPRLIEPV